jgi:hypothetical protein
VQVCRRGYGDAPFLHGVQEEILALLGSFRRIGVHFHDADPSTNYHESLRMHFRESNKQKPSLLDMMQTHVMAAKFKKKTSPNAPLKELVDKSISEYNMLVKKNRAYQITTETRKMILTLAKCPERCVDELQRHYLKYKHNETGYV